MIVTPDAPGHGRDHARIVEIELGLIDGGNRGIPRRRGDAQLRNALVISLLGSVVVLAKLRGALELDLGKLDLRLGLRKLRLCGFERELERPRLDDEQ